MASELVVFPAESRASPLSLRAKLWIGFGGLLLILLTVATTSKVPGVVVFAVVMVQAVELSHDTETALCVPNLKIVAALPSAKPVPVTVTTADGTVVNAGTFTYA